MSHTLNLLLKINILRKSCIQNHSLTLLFHLDRRGNDEKKKACANITKIEAGGKTTKTFSLFQIFIRYQQTHKSECV